MWYGLRERPWESLSEEVALKLLLSTGEENLVRGKEFQVERETQAKPLKRKDFGVFEELNEMSRLQLENGVESARR